MQDPNSLTLEEIEDFMADTEGGNSEYTFTLQTGGAESNNNEAPVRDAEEVGEGNLNADDITFEEEPTEQAPEPTAEEIEAEEAEPVAVSSQPEPQPEAVSSQPEPQPEAVDSEEPDLGNLNNDNDNDNEEEPEPVNSEEPDLGNLDNDNENVEFEEEEPENEEGDAPENVVGLEDEEEPERQAGEYIIEMNDFEFLDSDKPVFIREEIQLPDYKVVTTEEEQIADLTNELMKSIPEEKRTDKGVLRTVRRRVEAFIKLKAENSVYKNGEISDKKLLGNLHSEIIENILNGDFSNKLYSPIVNHRKTIYQNETTDKEGNTTMMFPLESSQNILKTNTEVITNQSSLRRRYKNDTRLRHNYSYIAEMGELNESFDDYTEMGNNGYKINLKNPTEVYNAAFEDSDLATISKCFPESRKLDKYVASGDISLNLEGNPFSRNNNINVVGIVKNPDLNTKHSNFIEKPLRHCVNENYLDFSLREKIINTDTQNISLVNLNFERGTKVKVCLPNPDVPTKTIDVSGTIIGYHFDSDSDEDLLNQKYKVELENPPKGINKVLKIKKGDKSITVDRRDLLNDDGTLRECYHTGSAIFRFPNEIGSKFAMRSLLESVIPKSENVIREHFNDILFCENLNQVNDILKKYNISTDNLTNELITPIRKNLEAKNETTLNTSRAERAKLQDLLKADPVVKKQMVELLNRKLLEEFREFYGEYPHYNTNVDSTAERLRWLYSQYDGGTLFFKTIILKRFGSFFRNIATSSSKIQDELNKLLNREEKLQEKIEELLNEVARKGGECPARKLVKVYTNVTDLENDNLKEIEIDTDKRPIIDSSEARGVPRDDDRHEGMDERDMYLVKPGDYCLLDTHEEKSIYKRSNISGGDMWIKEDGINVDALVSSTRDFCNQFTLNIDDLTKQLKGRRDGCYFNSKRNICLPAEVEKLDNELADLQLKKTDRLRMSALVRDSATYNEYLDTLTKRLRKTLKLYRKLQENTYKYAEREYEKVAEAEPDEYTDFYNKVDKYLTSVNSLPGEERCKMLIPFLDKYGRDADATEGENPKNIYSKIGNRVLMCKHHKVLINFYTNSENAENTFKYLKNNWCAESEGKLYCTNCGQEVFDADYETVEGFAANGAHLVSAEAMAPDEDAENALAEVKYIEGLLENEESREDAKFIEDICKTLTKIMGIRLRDADKSGIVRKTIEVNNVNIKTREAWLAGQKKLPKNQAVIDKAFRGYRNRNIIINTAGVAFIFLQANVFGYEIKNPHSKCKASLRGYPLDEKEDNDSGLRYITCLLETLRDSASEIYNSLKKAKIDEGIRRVISYCLKDTYIQEILKTRRESIDLEVSTGKNVRRDWGEFKPPMMKYDVSYDNTEIMEPENPSYDEHNNLLGMKVIQNINSVIDKARVENRMFDPVPLGNTCCAEKLDDNYDYRNYFIESGDVVPLVDTLNTMSNSKPSTNIQTRIIMDRVVSREAPEKFDKLVSPETEDEEARKLVFVNNITEGRYIGKPHIFDEFGICVLTGASKEELLTKVVSIEEYNNFIDELSKSKLYPSIKNERVYNVINVLNELRTSNSVLRGNDFIGETIEKLSQFKSGDSTEALDEVWNELDSQISIERDALIGIISQATGKRQIGTVSEALENLGKLNNIRSDNNEKLGEELADELFYERREKLLQNYFHKLRVMINRINNQNIIDEDTVRMLIPNGWKKSASDAILGRLVSSNIKSNKNVHKNIELLISNREIKKLVKTLSNFIDKNTIGVKSILGKKSIVNCDTSVKLVSVLSTQNSGDLLYYTMILTLIEMMKTIETSTELSSLMEKGVGGTVFDEVLDVPEGGASRNTRTGLDEDEEDEADETEPEVSGEEGGDISLAIKDAKRFTAELIIDFLLDNKKEQDLLDKYTYSYIQKSITKDAEEQKEDNLRFMEQLETEARQSLKAMLTIGVDSWKNLASKNRELYFEVPEDQREVDEQVGDDIEIDLRTMAVRDLGEGFTDADFEEWRAQTSRSEMIEREALREHIMPGDDGDALDYNSDNDYVND